MGSSTGYTAIDESINPLNKSSNNSHEEYQNNNNDNNDIEIIDEHSIIRPQFKTKRANSTIYENDRNKFRTKLGIFPINSDKQSIPNISITTTSASSSSSSSSSVDSVSDTKILSILENDIKNFTTISEESTVSSSSSSSSSSSNSTTDQTQRYYSTNSHINLDDLLQNIQSSSISSLSPELIGFLSTKKLNDYSIFPIRIITQPQYKLLINWHYSNPLPDCNSVFPWLHGINNSIKPIEFLNSISNFTTVKYNNFDSLNLNHNNGNNNNLNEIFSNNSSRGLIPIRSCPIKNNNKNIDDDNDDEFNIVENSAILKGSCDIEEILSPLNLNISINVDCYKDLLVWLTDFLKDLKIDNQINSSIKFQKILQIIYKDCIDTNLLPIFKKIDPQRGISLRNFHIQVSKISQISDFIVYCFNDDHNKIYGEEKSYNCKCLSVARLLSFAQFKHSKDYPELLDRNFSTLILGENDLNYFTKSESNSQLLAIHKIHNFETFKKEGNFFSDFDLKSFHNWDYNYLAKEQLEISKMSSATYISNNVWFGNITDVTILKNKGISKVILPKIVNNNIKDSNSIPLYIDPNNSTVVITKDQLIEKGEELLINPAREDWKLLINCCDGSNFPSLENLEKLLENNTIDKEYVLLNFPPSGSIGIGDCTDSDLISILNTCKLLYTKSSTSRPSLIYCSDGYTESSLLGICYLIYSTGKPLKGVVIDLHKIHGRPFFLFPTDITLISRIEDILIHYSPKNYNPLNPYKLTVIENRILYQNLFGTKNNNWCTDLNGSMPSRILQHLYLGSLTHANSNELMKLLGITRIVSVGEELNWLHEENSLNERRINKNLTILEGFTQNSQINKIMSISNIQDDGVDTLTHNLYDILEFLEDCYNSNEKVLVHCRVGVSRSATVCIAEVMKRLNIGLIKAYIYVRVRRLNIIIQPNLRFMYELVKWEENSRLRSKKSLKLENSNDIRHLGSNDDINYEISINSSGSFIDNSMDSVNLKNFETESKESSEINDSVIGELEDITTEVVDTLENKRSEWLRDVDWHILCRQIDLLNKTYIREH
ncbi:hypothetical protein WICMUC_005985 [Wickerhamomyces mucosus]|uniref:Uncharacterized protein n=1 Tax=Wickerhamomyces mucosus TaxID=1378264 RepID=A0A9P8P1P6_9ASCO|nr:hypothetical protein WICMUC_005985 [Wickerhamomyces mucosus]